MSSVSIRDASISVNMDVKATQVTATMPIDDSDERRISKKRNSMTSTGAIIREENEHSLT